MSYKIDIKSDDKKSNENAVADALRDLKKIMKKEGTFAELRRREYHMTPSQKRKFKKAESFKRKKREERKHQWFIKNKQNELDQNI